MYIHAIELDGDGKMTAAAHLRRYVVGRKRGRAGRDEGRCRGPRLLHRPRRHLGLRPRRLPARNYQNARSPGQFVNWRLNRHSIITSCPTGGGTSTGASMLLGRLQKPVSRCQCQRTPLCADTKKVRRYVASMIKTTMSIQSIAAAMRPLVPAHLHEPPVLILVAMVAVSLLWNGWVGLSWEPPLAKLLLPPAIFLAVSTIYATIRPRLVIAEVFLYHGLWMLFPVFGARLTYLASAAGLPLQDNLFRTIDEILDSGGSNG